MGLELLEPEDKRKLDQIKSNHPYNNGVCCKQMFQLWLKKCPNASWNWLIQALREVDLKQLASNMQGMLEKTEGIVLSSV